MIIRATSSSAPTAGTPPVDHTITIASGPGSDLTPKAALYRCNGSATLASSIASARGQYGMTDGTTQRALGILSENGQSGINQDNRTRHDTATVVQAPLGASGSINGEAFWDSWQTGGSKIKWADLLNAAYLIVPTYFFGDDIQCKVVEFAGDATENTEKSTDSLGFQPDLLIFYSHFSPYAADSNSADARVCIGYAVWNAAGTIQQFGMSARDTDRSTFFAGAHRIYDDRVVVDVGSVSDGASLEVTGRTSDVAKITTRDASASVSTSILAIAFTSQRYLYAGVLPTTDPGGGAPWLDTSSTGVKSTITVGFRPEAYFMVGTLLTSKNSTNRAASQRGKYSDGHWTGSEEFCISWRSGDATGSPTPQSTTTSNTLAKIAHVLNASGTTDWEANHDSVTTSGPQINVTTASAAARMVGICVIGGPIVQAESVQVSDDTLQAWRAVLSEDVQVSDSTVAVKSTLQLSEDVQVSDATQQAWITSLSEDVQVSDDTLQAWRAVLSEDVQVSDSALFVSTTLELTEDVAIGDQVLFVGFFDTTESVAISDDIVTRTIGSNDVMLVTSEDVLVSEQFNALFTQLTVGEDVEITDTEHFHQNFISTEDVQVFDDVRFRGTGVGVSVTEDVLISDSFVAFLGRVLDTSESVLISDSANFGAGTVSAIVGAGRGRTLQPGAELGVTIQAGSKRGSTS